MRGNELAAQLQEGQTIISIGNKVIVKDAQGATLTEYKVGSFDGQLWLTPGIKTEPPPGYLRVTNLYVDPVTKKLVVEYDDTPV